MPREPWVVTIIVAYLDKTERRQLPPRIWAGVAIAVAGSLAFGVVPTCGPRVLGPRPDLVVVADDALHADRVLQPRELPDRLVVQRTDSEVREKSLRR